MIEDRTSVGSGDCYIVTGGIGPHYQPRLFRKLKDARRYAEMIDRHDMIPEFTPVIERRFAYDVPSMKVE